MHHAHRQNVEHPLRRKNQQEKIAKHVQVKEALSMLDAAERAGMDVDLVLEELKNTPNDHPGFGSDPTNDGAPSIENAQTATDGAAPSIQNAPAPPDGASISIQPAEAAPTPPEASREQKIWASQVDPKELKTTPCAVFIILGRPYKNNIDRGKILRTIHATIQKLSKDPTNVDAIPIIVAASDHTEFKKWAAASHYEDEHFHFGAVSQLFTKPAAFEDVNWHILVATNGRHRTDICRPSKP